MDIAPVLAGPEPDGSRQSGAALVRQCGGHLGGLILLLGDRIDRNHSPAQPGDGKE